MMSFVRALMLAGVALAMFGIAAFLLVQLVPGPHSAGDLLIMGCLATLIALFAVFLVLISTYQKGSENFFRMRRK